MSFPKVVVSIASYPKRMPYICGSVETLLRQTIVPDEICLTLAREEFGENDESLMAPIREMGEAGITVFWAERNLRPHNKYFWCMQSHPEDIVITVDDDIVYPPTLVQSLLEQHYCHPEAVVANRTHIVTKNEKNELLPYKQWVMEQSESFDRPQTDLLATGAGGILYPPHAFDSEVFDADAIEDTCLLADDLWLFVHEIRLGIPVVNTTASPYLFYVPGSQEEGLYIENLDNGRNDVVLAGLFERYPSVRDALVRAARQLTTEAHEVEDDRASNNPGFFSRIASRFV